MAEQGLAHEKGHEEPEGPLGPGDGTAGETQKAGSSRLILASAAKGAFGMTAMLGVYFGIVSLISGWAFATSQFSQYWYFIAALAVGFGIQIGLFTYLRGAIRGHDVSSKVVAVSGTTTTVAMIACCAHYLANLLPIIGVSGALALIGQYRIELFWVGLAANVVAIAYISSRIVEFLKS